MLEKEIILLYCFKPLTFVEGIVDIYVTIYCFISLPKLIFPLFSLFYFTTVFTKGGNQGVVALGAAAA